MIPKTIVLVFPELVLKGLPEWENGAQSGAVPSQPTHTPKASFANQIPENRQPQNRGFSTFPYSRSSKQRSANQKGIKRPVFLPLKSVIPDYKPVNQ